MKKLLFLMMTVLFCVKADAFVFDGIDLNANYLQIMRAISAKGYAYDQTKDCLVGKCQGTEIFLSFNLQDTSDKKKIGQMNIEIPMGANAAEAAVAYKNAAGIFNVIYHQEGTNGGAITYKVDEDGTTMTLVQTEKGIRLTYNTPYYKPASK